MTITALLKTLLFAVAAGALQAAANHLIDHMTAAAAVGMTSAIGALGYILRSPFRK
jgi:hypothetical protein